MKCVHCEVACATLECSECKVAGEEPDVKCQLCEECSDLIHKGKMKHSVTPRPINKEELYEARKKALKEKLEKLGQETSQIRRRKKEMASLRGDLQNHIREKEQELRRVVQELQQKVKDKCRSLYLQMKEEVNNQCIELNELEELFDEHNVSIEQLQREMVKSIQDLDEDEFLEAESDMVAKITSLHLSSLPKPLPDFSLKRLVDTGDIETKVQNISLREPRLDEDPLQIPALTVHDDLSIQGNVYGRMSKDGTFLFQPMDVDSDRLFHCLNIISASIKKTYIENMDWQTLHDSGTEASVGEHLLVMDDEYNLWLRGRVEEIRPDGHCQILFTDYGNIKPVPADKLLPKRSSLYDNFPSQTIECTIFDGPKFDIPNSARWAFADTLHDAQSPCTCTIKSKVEVEGKSRDLWRVEITIEHEDSVTNVNDIVDSKVEESSQGIGAIKCRDVRLMDNPEVYSKLTKVSIEHPSYEKNSLSKTEKFELIQAVEPESTSQTEAASSTDANLQSDEDANSFEQVPKPTHANVTPIDSSSPITGSNTDTEKYEMESSKESEKGREVWEGEEQLLVNQRHADSPSCDDYQSAASSLDEAASGSITPVSASSHISNLPHQIQDESGEPEQDELATKEVHNLLKTEKRKKKKKRRDSELSADERNGDEEKQNDEPEQAPVSEDKPFILCEWLKQMGTELSEHKKLKANLQPVSKLLSGASNLEVGDFVTALDERDMWQRAIVTAIKGKKAEVQFVDIPKERTLLIESYIKPLLPKLRALPPAVVLPESVQEILYMRHGGSDESMGEPAFVTPAPAGQKLAVDMKSYPSNEGQFESNDPNYDQAEGFPVQHDEMTNAPPHGFPHHGHPMHGSPRGPPDGRFRRPNDRGENGEWRKHRDGRDMSGAKGPPPGHMGQDRDRRDGGNRRMNKGGGGRENKKRTERRKGGKGRYEDRQWGRPSGNDSGGPRQQSDNSRPDDMW